MNSVSMTLTSPSVVPTRRTQRARIPEVPNLGAGIVAVVAPAGMPVSQWEIAKRDVLETW